MRWRFAWLLMVGLTSMGQLRAQAVPAPAPADEKPPAEKKDAAPAEKKDTAPADKKDAAPADKKDTAAAPTGPATVNVTKAEDCPPNCLLWAQADYLLWWVKGAPLPVPLVTTGNPAVGFNPDLINTVNTAGAIGQPGTRILLGDQDLDFSAASGARLTLGGWLPEAPRLGVEGSGFVLERVQNRFQAASDNAGFPPLYFPIFSAIAGAERAIPIADPLRAFSGNVAVTSTLQLWGAEANLLGALYRNPDWTFSVLAGFRYADLREKLQTHNTTTDLLFGNVMVLGDSFGTTNQFYGGQFGGRFEAQLDRLCLEVTGKVAVGSAHQVVNIQGEISQLGPNPLVPPGLGTFPGGIFAQPSNIGEHNANPLSVPFCVLPSLELKAGWQIGQGLRVFAGYEVLYWTRVLRPGDQIDREVNLTQNAVLDPNGVGMLVGPARPTPLFNRGDFWAQGLSFGLEYCY